MTDSLVLGLVTAGIGLMTISVNGFIAYKMQQLKNSGDDAAKEVRAVAVDLKTSDATTTAKIDCIQEITQKTLVHVNDQYLVQLRLYKDAMRVIADFKDTTEDRERFEAANKLYLEHEARQKEEAAKQQQP